MRRDDRHELQKQEAFALGGAPCKSLVKCPASHLPRDWRAIGPILLLQPGRRETVFPSGS